MSFPLGIAVRGNPVKAFVTIIEGCNDFCAFCVVPYTRGHERMRAAREILDELERLAARNKSAPSVQLTLLTPEEHPVVAQLRALDPEQLSPLDALSLLYELRRAADA